MSGSKIWKLTDAGELASSLVSFGSGGTGRFYPVQGFMVPEEQAGFSGSQKNPSTQESARVSQSCGQAININNDNLHFFWKFCFSESVVGAIVKIRLMTTIMYIMQSEK